MTFCGLCPIVIGQPLPKEALRVGKGLLFRITAAAYH
jgi:hypothetical protein